MVVSVHYSTKTGGMRKISRRALYVGFSRCPTLSGLFIAGKFEAPNAPGPDDPVIVEMSKLRKRPVIFDGEQDNFDDKDGNLMAGKSVEQKIVSKKEIQIDSDNDNESVLKELKQIAILHNLMNLFANCSKICRILY